MGGDLLEVGYIVTLLTELRQGASLRRTSHTRSWLPANLLALQKTKKNSSNEPSQKNKQLSLIERGISTMYAPRQPRDLQIDLADVLHTYIKIRRGARARSRI